MGGMTEAQRKHRERQQGEREGKREADGEAKGRRVAQRAGTAEPAGVARPAVSRS